MNKKDLGLQETKREATVLRIEMPTNEIRPEFCICEEHTDFKDEHCEDCQREWAYFQQQYRDFEIDLNLRD